MTSGDGAPPRRRWPWIVGGTVGAIVLLSASALIPSSMVPLDQEVARLRAAGLPATCEEAWGVDPPDAENGWLDLVAARADLEKAEGAESAWTVTGPWDPRVDAETWLNSASPAQIAELQTFLRRAQPFFDRVDAGLAKPSFHPKQTPDAGGVPVTAWVGTLQRVARMLAARAEAGATPQERIAAMVAASHLGRRVEPASVMALSVSLSATAGPCCHARRAAEDGSIPAADLRRALDPWLREPVLARFAQAARSSPAWIATVYRAARDGTSPQVWQSSAWQRLGRQWQRKQDGIAERVDRLFGRSGRLHAAPFFQLEYAETDEVVNAMRLWSEAAAADESSCVRFREAIDAVEQRWQPDATGLLRTLRDVSKRLVDGDTARALARVALAAAERHEATGAWPGTAAELRDAFEDGVPLDPYTDAPFVIELTETTVRVRSAGAFAGDALAGDATLRERILLWEFPR